MSCNVHKINAGWFCVQVLGAKEGFFVKLVDSVVDNFGGFYPELVAKRDHITGVIRCAAVVTLSCRVVPYCADFVDCTYLVRFYKAGL